MQPAQANPMQSPDEGAAVFFGCPSQPYFMQSLHYDSERDVLYLHNAKSGCSTVKYGLIAAMRSRQCQSESKEITAKDIHGQNSLWSHAFHRISVDKTYAFSVVRNPFTRILSAYLDQICRKGILRNQFLLQHGLAPDVELSFTEFLRLLDDKSAIFDQHWRPQVENLCLGHVPVHEIYYLENFAETAPGLSDRLGIEIGQTLRQNHATNASDKVAGHLTDEALEIIRQLYRDDFRIFGYSTDPADAGAAPATSLQSASLAMPPAAPLKLTGLLQSNVEGEELARKCTALPMGFFEHAILARKAPSGTVLPGAELFGRQVEQFSRSGPLYQHFVAHKYIADTSISDECQESREHSIRKVLAIAPYLAGYRVHLVKCLLRQRRRMQRIVELAFADLEKATWPSAVKDELRQQLRD